MRKFAILITSISLTLIGAQSHATEDENMEFLCPNPDHLLIAPTGIYVYTKNRDRLLPVETAFVHQGRLTVSLAGIQEIIENGPEVRGPCFLHPAFHLPPRGCGGCGVLLCPANCTCFD